MGQALHSLLGIKALRAGMLCRDLLSAAYSIHWISGHCLVLDQKWLNSLVAYKKFKMDSQSVIATVELVDFLTSVFQKDAYLLTSIASNNSLHHSESRAIILVHFSAFWPHIVF